MCIQVGVRDLCSFEDQASVEVTFSIFSARGTTSTTQHSIVSNVHNVPTIMCIILSMLNCVFMCVCNGCGMFWGLD